MSTASHAAILSATQERRLWPSMAEQWRRPLPNPAALLTSASRQWLRSAVASASIGPDAGAWWGATLWHNSSSGGVTCIKLQTRIGARRRSSRHVWKTRTRSHK